MVLSSCQMLLFSATFEESVWNFARRIVPDPNIIKLKREEETLDTIKQYYVLCNSKEEKFQALCNIYGAITIAQAMIFCHVSSAPGSNSVGSEQTPEALHALSCLLLTFYHWNSRIINTLLFSWQKHSMMMMMMMTVVAFLFDPDKEDCGLAGRRAV